MSLLVTQFGIIEEESLVDESAIAQSKDDSMWDDEPGRVIEPPSMWDD